MNKCTLWRQYEYIYVFFLAFCFPLPADIYLKTFPLLQGIWPFSTCIFRRAVHVYVSMQSHNRQAGRNMFTSAGARWLERSAAEEIKGMESVP